MKIICKKKKDKFVRKIQRLVRKIKNKNINRNDWKRKENTKYRKQEILDLFLSNNADCPDGG